MDSVQFDRLAHIVSTIRSRRTTLAALACGVFGAGFLALLDDAEAKKKHKRKNKRKKCKSGTKKCGKKCIPVASCCSSADCGQGGTCATGICHCPSGFKGCNGSCIAESDCCGACRGETICVGGECVCPDHSPFACPGDVCVISDQCCDPSECPNPQECSEGLCLCPGTNAINCDALCCDGNTAVCAFRNVDDERVASCQAGGCPATDICSDFETEEFVCANDFVEHVCFCTSTADLIPGRVCVDAFSLGDESCEACDASSDCGSGRVCVADGPGCNCGSNFCVRLCPEGADREAKRGTGGKPVDLDTLMGGVQMRHR
jgi:hypothetical protein